MRIFKNEIEITSQVERLDSTSTSLSYVSGEYIYFTADFPFNHLFFKFGITKNIINATMTVEYYSAGWIPVVEIRDGTNGFKQDGYVEFTPNRNFGWARTFDSAIVGVSQVVYDKHWVRIKFDTDLTTAVQVNYIGHKFSDDTDLFSEYPIFDDSTFLTAFKSGKTSWEEQHVKASDIIISDLIKKGIVIAPEQILDRKKFISASICKTAEIIFTSFGNDYDSARKLAKEEYTKRLDLSQYNTDINNNAILEVSEVKASQGWLSR